MKTYFKIMFLVLSFVMIQNVYAQDKDTQKVLTKKEKNTIVSSIQTHLNTTYIDLEISQKMISELNTNLKTKKYKEIIDPSEFSKALTEDLQGVRWDKIYNATNYQKAIGRSHYARP